MSYIFYPPTKYHTPTSFNCNKFDPHVFYAKHAINYYRLKNIIHTSTDFEHKNTALREINIAERKMRYWSNSPKFQQKIIGQIHNRARLEARL